MRADFEELVRRYNKQIFGSAKFRKSFQNVQAMNIAQVVFPGAPFDEPDYRTVVSSMTPDNLSYFVTSSADPTFKDVNEAEAASYLRNIYAMTLFRSVNHAGEVGPMMSNLSVAPYTDIDQNAILKSLVEFDPTVLLNRDLVDMITENDKGIPIIAEIESTRCNEHLSERLISLKLISGGNESSMAYHRTRTGLYVPLSGYDAVKKAGEMK